MESTNENSDRQDVNHGEAILRLFSQHQRWLFGYLTSLLGNPGDAEDVMQEVSVVMWQQHEKFQLGTNFASWLSVIAYHQVQRFWREKKKRKQFLSVATAEQLADRVSDDFELLEARRQALAKCVASLSDSDRQLVSHCYSERQVTFKAAARELKRPTGSVYKAMGRIRRSLQACINRTLSAEGIA